MTKLKMLQARFDLACSWMVLSSANCRPITGFQQLEQNLTFKHENGETFKNLETSGVWFLSKKKIANYAITCIN
jgi:hypothetical protein